MYSVVSGALFNFFEQNKIEYKHLDTPALASDITDAFEKELQAYENNERLKFGEEANPDVNKDPEVVIEKHLLEMKGLRGAMQTFRNIKKNSKPGVVEDVGNIIVQIDFAIEVLKKGKGSKEDRLSSLQYLLTHQKISSLAQEIVEKYTGQSIFS